MNRVDKNDQTATTTRRKGSQMLCSLLNGRERKENGKDPSRTDSLNSWLAKVGGRRRES